jgi:hypothetical protein
VPALSEGNQSMTTTMVHVPKAPASIVLVCYWRSSRLSGGLLIGVQSMALLEEMSMLWASSSKASASVTLVGSGISTVSTLISSS